MLVPKIYRKFSSGAMRWWSKKYFIVDGSKHGKHSQFLYMDSSLFRWCIGKGYLCPQLLSLTKLSIYGCPLHLEESWYFPELSIQKGESILMREFGEGNFFPFWLRFKNGPQIFMSSFTPKNHKKSTHPSWNSLRKTGPSLRAQQQRREKQANIQTLARALSHRRVHEKIIAEGWSCALIFVTRHFRFKNYVEV